MNVCVKGERLVLAPWMPSLDPLHNMILPLKLSCSENYIAELFLSFLPIKAKSQMPKAMGVSSLTPIGYMHMFTGLTV